MFHKKYARINTPPDKNDANKYISSKMTLIPLVETPSVSTRKYVSNKRSAILDSMNVQAKKKSDMLTLNTITEFGKISIGALLKRSKFSKNF